jgi:hypothetical protein
VANKLLAVLTSVAAIITTAMPARADTGTDTATGADAAFLKTLDKEGITYQSPDRAIAAAKKICELAGTGVTQLEILKDIRERNPGFTLDGAAKFTDAAASAYCPGQVAAPPNKLTTRIDAPNTKSE